MSRRRAIHTRAGRVTLAVVAVLGWSALGAPLQAQEADFLFGTPKVTLGIHGGFFQASTGSQVYDFTTENLTVEPSDFDTPAFRVEIATRVSPQLDLAFDLGYSRAEIVSESRDFIGTDDLPIVQTTRLTRIPITVSGKFYLRDRGRSIGTFAWIPNRWTAYLGAGGGFVNYTFVQEGEFVVEETLEIVRDDLRSGTIGGVLQLLGGAEVSLSPRVLLTLDGRYRWASAGMDDDWAAFDDIDLSGFTTSLGLALRL